MIGINYGNQLASTRALSDRLAFSGESNNGNF